MTKYPARCKKESEVMYFLEFIDFPGAMTSGESLEELINNAQDVLSLAIKFNLDRDRGIPCPSVVEGDDIMMVEPFPEIRQRMGHKKDCECPVCRNARGERPRNKVKVGIMIDRTLWNKVTMKAKTEGKKKIEILEAALRNVV